MYLKHGITSNRTIHIELKLCISAANSITLLGEYIFKSITNNTIESGKIQEMLSRIDPIFTELLELIIGIVILEDSNFMWSLNRPLFALILIHESIYEEIVKAAVIKAIKNTEYQEKLVERFLQVMAGVPRNIEKKSKEIFFKNFNDLRNTISSFY